VENRPQVDDVLRMVYLATKAADPGRPCIDSSGGLHVITDIYDVHDYEQNPQTFKANYDRFVTEGYLYDWAKNRFRMQSYEGGPVFISEYGGIRWAEGETDKNRRGSWGYGKDVEDAEDFKRRFQGLADAILDNCKMLGFCYTQLTDVEQEQNGLYTYDRKAKFDPAWVKSVLSRKAAIEEE